MNVLHLVSGRATTGPVAAALTDVRALRAAGHRAWLASRDGSGPEYSCAAHGVPFVGGFRFGKGAARLLNLPRDARRLRELCGELGLDIVHVHRSHDQLVAGWALRGNARRCCVRTWHRDPGLLAGPLRRHLSAATNAHLCVSSAHVGALHEIGARHAAYMPPGVDTACYRPIEKPAHAPCRIGLVGRWKSREDRGQRAFLEVLRRLRPEAAWRGVLLGHGEDRANLERLLAEHPYGDRIELLKTTDRFAQQVAELDLGLVFATGSDGSSRPALEMLACGVPLLLADRPGLRELGEGNRGARVLPVSAPDAWAQACTEWLEAPDLRLRAGAAAREVAEERHALVVHGRRLAEFYGRALQPW